MAHKEQYDFIVVGSGPAGSMVASRLARTKAAPSVLLLEAGGANAEPDTRALAERFKTVMTAPDMNWGYKTVPQKHLNGRELDYSRGRGLGGTSAINFACYTVGPSDDYDEWARLVGDEAFSWASARQRYNGIETYDVADLSDAFRKHVDPAEDGAHGVDGPLHVEFAKEANWGVDMSLEAAVSIGLSPNRDLNSGNPLGVGIPPSTARRGVRITARSAFLEDPPENLTILTHSLVERVVFEGKRAVGVLANGKTYRASKEVIVSAGALDTPKLLMLSGIGPEDELAAHEIEPVQHLAGVGKNLQDHAYVEGVVELKDGLTGRPALFNNADALAAAKKQFDADGTGPFSVHYHTIVQGWQQLDHRLHSLPEFASLSPAVQAHMRKPPVPAWELVLLCPALHPAADPAREYLSVLVIQMTPGSTGTVTLRSSDPRDPPVCDPNLFDHPFDRKNLAEGLRRSLKFFNAPVFAEHIERPFSVPAGDVDHDDDAVWRFIQENAGTAWHMSATVKMGKPDDAMACVDSDFRVRGVQALRVVDNSVMPFLLNCHVVSVAYFIGATAAEKLIAEYGLQEG